MAASAGMHSSLAHATLPSSPDLKHHQHCLASGRTWVTRGAAGAPSTSEPCSISARVGAWSRRLHGLRDSVAARTGALPRKRHHLRATGDFGRRPAYKRLPNEHDINLSEYMVSLDNPIGLTLAPDQSTGKILVQHVHAGSPADECKLIQAGDVLTACSTVFGDDMLQCSDLQRTRWAIMNRVGQVRLVFERPASRQLQPWYCAGREGIMSSGPSSMQLPVKLVAGGSDVADLTAGRGKCLHVAFNKCAQPPSQVVSRRQGNLARLARAAALRQELEAAAAMPELDLSASASRSGPSSNSTKQQPGSHSLPSTYTPGMFRRQPSSSNGRVGGARRAEKPNAERDRRVLHITPWLLLSSGRLSLSELTQIASARALDSILEMSLKLRDGVIISAGPRPLTREQGLIQAAAALQRLITRRLRSVRNPEGRERCSVLIHCEEGEEAQAAPVLAGWLHWYQGFEWNDAIAAAEQAVGASAQEPLLASCSRLLLRRAPERCSRVVLTWRYGGLVAEVSGDLVGGWEQRQAMTRCLSTHGCMGAGRGEFYLEFRNLQPGLYHYKYIIDDTWALDPRESRDLDESGNWNNVVEVLPPPPMDTPEQKLHFVRWEAAHLALALKLGCGGVVSSPWGPQGQQSQQGQGQQQQQQGQEEYVVPSEAEYSVPLADLAPPGIVPPLPPPLQQHDTQAVAHPHAQQPQQDEQQ